jgi:hypothetical protein
MRYVLKKKKKNVELTKKKKKKRRYAKTLEYLHGKVDLPFRLLAKLRGPN